MPITPRFILASPVTLPFIPSSQWLFKHPPPPHKFSSLPSITYIHHPSSSILSILPMPCMNDAVLSNSSASSSTFFASSFCALYYTHQQQLQWYAITHICTSSPSQQPPLSPITRICTRSSSQQSTSGVVSRQALLTNVKTNSFHFERLSPFGGLTHQGKLMYYYR